MQHGLDRFIDSVVLMLVLLNPLLMSAYLREVMNNLSAIRWRSR